MELLPRHSSTDAAFRPPFAAIWTGLDDWSLRARIDLRNAETRILRLLCHIGRTFP